MRVRWVLCALAALAAPAAARANALDHLLTVDDIGENKIPHLGTSRILVVPMSVGDDFPAGRLAELRAFYAPDGGPGTFRDYWRTVSGDRYDPIPTVAEPVVYPDRCPIPERDVGSCTLSFADDDLLRLIGRGYIGVAVADVLSRARDEQGLDLADFDANGAAAGQPDGFLDGLVLDSSVLDGIAFPLAALGNGVAVGATRADDPAQIACGIVAMAPPHLHEFAHLFGFLDLYGGPTVASLLAAEDATLDAFSRQQIGWGEVQEIRAPGTLRLPPVLDGGAVLRFGAPPRYLLLEHRGGARHAELDSIPSGLYVTSVDEGQLPTSPLGFLDVEANDIYLANATEPYLAVNVPRDCFLGGTGPGACARHEGDVIAMIHLDGTDTGYVVHVGATAGDGAIELRIEGPDQLAGAGCGCAVPRRGGRGLPLPLLAILAWLTRRKKGTGGRTP